MNLDDFLGDGIIDFLSTVEYPSEEMNIDELFDDAYGSLDSTHAVLDSCAGALELHLPSCTASAVPEQPRPTFSRFAAPLTDEDIAKKRKNAIPEKTKKDTQYCISVWEAWCKHRRENTSCNIPPLTSITLNDLQFWLVRFIHEVRKQNGEEYPPNSLLHLCNGIVRHVRSTSYPDLDLFQDSAFAEFKSSLDAEMKRLQAKGLGSKHRQAEPITEEEEDLLWEKGLLGDHSPQALLNTIIYMNGLYFALRSGNEHRSLRFSSSQIQAVVREGERPYLLYTEDCSKNHPGGLKGRHFKRKVVKHYANLNNPQRCFVRIFQKYRELCPPNPKNNAFYLQPLKKHSATLWYSREPLGHNKLAKTVSDMCSKAGIKGFRTNHSLRATSATRLFSAGADEQLIMERTGHQSVDGVRSYKRTSNHFNEEVSDILNRSEKRHKSHDQSYSKPSTPSHTPITTIPSHLSPPSSSNPPSFPL